MIRKFLPPLAGLALGALVLGLGLPLRANLFAFLVRLRGPIPPNPEITIVEFGEKAAESNWLELLTRTLNRLDSTPPKAVELDFSFNTPEEIRAVATGHSYPVFFERRTFASRPAEERLPLASLPSFVDGIARRSQTDPFLTGFANTDLMKAVSPTQLGKFLSGPPRVLNIAGPPGTYPRVPMNEVLTREDTRRSLQGRIILVAPPGGEPLGRIGLLPFFPRQGATSADETEVRANVIDTVLRGTGIRVLSRGATVFLTLALSVFTTSVLFWTTPLLGIFLIFLAMVLLFVASLAALNSSVFLDIHPALWGMLIAYYFLIPYRLIIEYKGRWRYQQENRLHSEVETLKANFMSLVSHNLKTPIARIEGLAETLLKKKEELSPSAREELSGILRASEDLNRFVSRILSLAQVERSDFRIRASTKDLNAIVEKVVESHRPAAEAKEIRLETKLEPLFPLKMDTELIQESVANLVENAIKYTPNGGSVYVVTRESGDWAHVEVADSGPGISEEDSGKLFSKFYRGAEVKNKGIRGSGLGLYLVKYFVELHGGTVEFKNRPEGGTHFTIQLPTR
ncbi:MAG: ATP-binding protein [Pseudomonadota bacterium]